MELCKWQSVDLVLFFNVGFMRFEVGSAGLLTCFFSTVQSIKTDDGKSARFQLISTDLYYGKLSCEQLEIAQKEVEGIADFFSAAKAKRIVVDDDVLTQRIHYENEINTSAATLMDCFLTINQIPLVTQLLTAIEKAISFDEDILITDLLGTVPLYD